MEMVPTPRPQTRLGQMRAHTHAEFWTCAALSISLTWPLTPGLKGKGKATRKGRKEGRKILPGEVFPVPTSHWLQAGMSKAERVAPWGPCRAGLRLFPSPQGPASGGLYSHPITPCLASVAGTAIHVYFTLILGHNQIRTVGPTAKLLLPHTYTASTDTHFK